MGFNLPLFARFNVFYFLSCSKNVQGVKSKIRSKLSKAPYIATVVPRYHITQRIFSSVVPKIENSLFLVLFKKRESVSAFYFHL